MQMFKNYVSKITTGDFFHLNILHILNDGFAASLVLLLPFIAQSQGLSLTQVGLLGTILNAAGVILALPAAYLATRFGGLKVLVVAAFVYGAAFLVTGGTGQFLVLLPVFVFAGIGFGVFHPIAFALIAKWTSKEKRGRTIGDFTAIGDVGRIGIAAALSFLAVAIGWQKAAILYAIVALIAAVFFYRYLFSDKTRIQPKKEHHGKTQDLSFWQVLRNKRYIMTICSAGFDGFASASLFVFLPFLLLQRHVDPAFLGAFTATFFVGTFFGKTLLGRFVDRWGGAKVFIVAEFLMAVFIYLLAGTTALPLIAVCSVILGIFTKGTVPVLQTMVTESVEHHGNFEKAFGIEGFVSSLGIALAPVALGFVSDKFGIISAFYVMAGSALLASVPAVAFFFMGRGSQEKA
ncbi:MAG TPA: MFS transporter [Candidatus Saccharimonadales bacterium]|nr:MFS transporter [Candidatus Saccharimonadales bacterium]